MWIASTSGFLSAGQANDNADNLVVRSRVKADLSPLIEFVTTHTMGAIVPEIITYEHSDYPWRIVAPKTVVSLFVAQQVMDVDYGNFKGAVAAEQGKPRANVYSSVWTALLGLERLDPDQRRAPKAPWWEAYGTDEDDVAYDEIVEHSRRITFSDEDDDDDWYDVDEWLARKSIHDLTDAEWLAQDSGDQS
jgi:hypothetical protein